MTQNNLDAKKLKKPVREADEKFINNALINGGNFHKSGVKIYVHKPRTGELGLKTGYWINSSLGFKAYFNTPNRAKAQKACDDVFGKGMYRVNTPE